MELTPTTSEFQPCRLPSFSETFSDLIAAHNSKPTPKYYDHAPPPLQPRRGSPGSEYSWHGGGGGAGAGGGIGSVPGLSPLSTAHTSPAVSPTTPTYSIPSQTQLEIQVRLGLLGPHHQQDALGHMDMVSNRRLLLARSRRASSAQHHHQQQQQSRRASGTGSVSGGRTASRQPSMTFHNDNHLSHSHDAAAAAGVGDARDSTTDRERHFNQKYKNPDKLFIVYCKDDLRWGWPAIQAQRLPLLPILLGNDYDRSVEERRKVAGLNGMYYRENDLNMPVLTPDGSGLEFVERDGRWWECTRSQKCRTGESNAAGSCGRKGSSTSTKRGSVGGCAADSRPRGMVERYPEEVLLYWDKHVRHFVPEDKRAEVYARAERYCKYFDIIHLTISPFSPFPSAHTSVGLDFFECGETDI